MQQNGNPFLIVGKMPHITKTVKQHWDNPELNLTAEQKTKLLNVRKETMTGVMKLTKEIESLENKVANEIFSGATPEDLRPIVDKIAKLKARATMIHLKCLYDTKNILDEQQFDFIMSVKE